MHEELIPARIKVEVLSCYFPRKQKRLTMSQKKLVSLSSREYIPLSRLSCNWLPVVSLHEFIGVVPFGNDADVTIVVDTLESRQATS